MSQHDYNLANQAGAAFRADANDALAAIVTNNSGATEPTATFAGMPWFDTTNGILKFRNASNTAWIVDDLNSARGSVTMHATTMDLWAEPKIIDGTGSSVTITDIADAPQAGAVRALYPVAGTVITDGATFDVDGGANYTTKAGDALIFEAVTTSTFKVHIIKADGTSVVNSFVPAVRQTVLSGPVDANGLPNFGGSTGGTTVTASGTLAVTAANGTSNRSGSITNPSWTGLSTNGTMYLYLDIAADGTVTSGSTVLEPIYQNGGTYSTTNGQNTFNIQEMTMKVGNGSVASDVYRVFVGLVSVSGNVVTLIRWFAIMGRYTGPWVSTLPSASTVFSQIHVIGVPQLNAELEILVNTTGNGYSNGDIIHNIITADSGVIFPILPVTDRYTIIAVSGNGGFRYQNRTNGVITSMNLANFSYRFFVSRKW